MARGWPTCLFIVRAHKAGRGGSREPHRRRPAPAMTSPFLRVPPSPALPLSNLFKKRMCENFSRKNFIFFRKTLPAVLEATNMTHDCVAVPGKESEAALHAPCS